MPVITRFVLHHKALVVLFWALIVVAGATTLTSTTSRMTNSFAMPGKAFQIDDQIGREYGNGGSQAPYVAMLTAPAGQRIADPVHRAQTGRVFAAAAAAMPHARLADYDSTGDPRFVTRDGRTTYALIYPPQPSSSSFGGAGLGPAVRQALSTAATSQALTGWTTAVTGSQLLATGSPSSSQGTGVVVEAMIGAIGALIILAVVFGSFLAVLPLLIGGVSVVSTFLAVGGLTHLTDVSQIVEFLIALIGLGVAIDFSLLIVSRWREERSAGRSNESAVTAAMDQAGRAVVFSGLTVAIGLLSLIVLPVPMLRSVGYGGVLVPLVSVAASITLLPVILGTVGPRLDWPRIRTEKVASRFWSGWARLVYRRRWAAALIGFAIIGALMLPAISMHLGEPASAAQATSGPAHDALATLVDGGVPSGVLTPIEVLVHPSATEVAARAANVPGVFAAFAPATPDYHRTGTAIVTVIPRDESSLPSGQDTVQRLQGALSTDGDVIGIGGVGASLVDFNSAVYGRFPLMLTLIGMATFVLLTRAFRSVLLAAKAVVFNLISLGAAYGVLTWVWQDGHGSQALWNIPATGAITMWVPLMVFAFLFGLSMDYEVFILTRIREAYDSTGDPEHAVIEGIGRTGRLVTSAAAILMLSFVSMSTGPETDLKILATGLGAGILVDAVVVRCLLVPAMVALFGRANWWLPARAAQLLRIAPVGSAA